MNSLKIVLLLISGFLLSCKQDRSTANTIQNSSKIDSVAVRQVVFSMHDAVMTKDLSDSLTFNQWTDFFTRDFLWMESGGKPPTQMGKDGFKLIREGMRTFKIKYDEIIIDYVYASCDLAYVAYHYRATFTTIKTNEKESVSRSALVILKRNEVAEWKISYQEFN